MSEPASPSIADAIVSAAVALPGGPAPVTGTMAEGQPVLVPAKAAPIATHTFYFSPSWAAALGKGVSISRFKGQQFTQVCKIGVAPLARPDNKRLGDGVLADVSTGK